MRGGILCVAVFAALAVAGCAKKESAAARIEGGEPQRLSFGDPVTVQRAFVQKMQTCWFGISGVLNGYPYDLAPFVTDSISGAYQVEQVVIFDRQNQRTPVFITQFHAFNDNTLIATRNLALPQVVAAQLKRDVETWVLERTECSGADRDFYGQPPAASGDLKSSAGQNGYGSQPPAR